MIDFGRTLGLLTAGAMLVGFGDPVAAQRPAPSPESQRQAMQIARETLADVLDVQLRQLRENGLEKRPLYAEIENMRARLDQLIQRDMEAVVQLLAAESENPGDGPQVRYGELRAAVRNIVARLAKERQVVTRRLRIAELAAQTRRLIADQTRCLNDVELAPTLDARGRESKLLAAVQDQRDVHSQLDLLAEALTDVASWGGAVGQSASQARDVIHSDRLPELAASVAAQLEASELVSAAGEQRAIVKGLQAALARLEAAQGFEEPGSRSAARQATELIERQTALRRDTQQLALHDFDAAARLTDRQLQIRQGIEKLAPSAEHVPGASELLEQAAAAAQEAERQLFEANRAAALGEQERVLEGLGRLAERLQESNAVDGRAQSADQLAAQASTLQRADRQLSDVRRTQQQASAEASTASESALAAQRRVAEQLAEMLRQAELPASVRRRLAEAQRRAAEALEALRQTEDAADAAAEASLRNSDAALKEAHSELRRQWTDVVRRQAAASVGELSRAAEALERASASEREIARQAAAAASQRRGLDRDAAPGLAAEQRLIRQTAESAADGAERTAPDAARRLRGAAPQFDQLDHALAAATASPEAAGAAAQQAATASEMLAEAAGKFRAQAARDADRLAKTTGRNDAPKTRELAAALVELAAEQQTAREEIRRQAERLVSAVAERSSDPPAEDGPLGRAALALDRAAQEFSDALRATGETAAALSSQREIHSVPLRQALETASRLELATAAGAAAADDRADDEGVDGSQTARLPGDLAAAELGVDFVPASPQKTAQQIAGPEALAAMRRVLSAEPPNPEIPGENDGPGDQAAGASRSGRGRERRGDSRSPGQQTEAADNDLRSRRDDSKRSDGGRSPGSEPSDRAGELRAGARGDASGTQAAAADQPSVDPRALDRDPWFARLPSEMRQAIRARAQRPAPRGYEDRLQRYFESAD